MVHPQPRLIRMLGPQDNGAVMTADEFLAARGEPGFRFELVFGELHVSPAPDPYAQNIVDRIHALLRAHRTRNAEPAFAEVITGPRVFVEGEDAPTIPEPDVAAYSVYPARPVRTYRGVTPALVVEIVAPGGAIKGYVRNVDLYSRVPSIQEYWVIDPRTDPTRPTMAVFHRRGDGRGFARLDVPAGGVHECERWPGLRVDLARIAVE